MDDIFEGRRKRLRLFINTLIIKDKQFADSIGKKPAVVSQLLNGYRNISADFVYEVAERYPFLNPDWLISGNGDMTRVVDNYQIEAGQPRTLEDLEEDYKHDPLAGLKEMLARLESLEKWREEVEGRKDKT